MSCKNCLIIHPSHTRRVKRRDRSHIAAAKGTSLVGREISAPAVVRSCAPQVNSIEYPISLSLVFLAQGHIALGKRGEARRVAN